MSKEFEPTIVAFLCNWCTFTAADLAGSSRLDYPQNIKVIRMMCSGMVDPVYVLKAFLEGADGVYIGGCWPGDCHYINGNLKARRRVALVKEILKQFGIEEDRFWLRWVAARLKSCESLDQVRLVLIKRSRKHSLRREKDGSIQ